MFKTYKVHGTPIKKNTTYNILKKLNVKKFMSK